MCTESPHSLDFLTNAVFQNSWGFGWSFWICLVQKYLPSPQNSVAKTRHNTVVKAILAKEVNTKSYFFFLPYRVFFSALVLSRCAWSWGRYWQFINGVHFSSPCTWQHKFQPWPFTAWEGQSSALWFPKHILLCKTSSITNRLLQILHYNPLLQIQPWRVFFFSPLSS